MFKLHSADCERQISVYTRLKSLDKAEFSRDTISGYHDMWSNDTMSTNTSSTDKRSTDKRSTAIIRLQTYGLGLGLRFGLGSGLGLGLRLGLGFGR